MSAEKWDKAFSPVEPIAGKEDEQSRERLVNFLEAVIDDVKSGSFFKLGLFSIKDGKLPNGYKYDFAIRQGINPSEYHVWGDPRPSDSMTERNVRRCIYCGCAYTKRSDGKRCLDRAEHNAAKEKAETGVER